MTDEDRPEEDQDEIESMETQLRLICVKVKCCVIAAGASECNRIQSSVFRIIKTKQYLDNKYNLIVLLEIFTQLCIKKIT